MKLTRQGVRDLGNNARVRRRAPQSVCGHLWESERYFDCHLDAWTIVRRCGLCHERRP